MSPRPVLPKVRWAKIKRRHMGSNPSRSHRGFWPCKTQGVNLLHLIEFAAIQNKGSNPSRSDKFFCHTKDREKLKNDLDLIGVPAIQNIGSNPSRSNRVSCHIQNIGRKNDLDLIGFPAIQKIGSNPSRSQRVFLPYKP